MNWLSPVDTGLVMGLIMAFSVYGLAIAFRLFNFPDLTIEGSFLLGAVGFAIAQKNGLNMGYGILISITFGAISGLLTGALHSVFKINKFLASIIVVSICYTSALRLMGSSNIGLLGSSTIFDRLDELFTDYVFSMGKLLFLCIFVVIVGSLTQIGLSSRAGLRLRVAGCNPIYAKTLKINVKFNIMIGLAATNALAATSGALLSLNQGFADVGLGQGVLVFALASMTLGERLISEQRHSVPMFILLSSIFGSIVYQILVAIAVRMGLNPVDLKLVTAVLVLILIVSKTKNTNSAFADI